MPRPRAVPVETVQAHLSTFLDAGYTHITLGHAGRVSPATINSIARGKHAKVKAGTASVLLALTHPDVLRAALELGKPVPHHGTTRRLQALYLQGWNCYRIADGTGLGVAALRRHLLGEHRVVPAHTHTTVAAFFAQNWHATPAVADHWRNGQTSRAIRTAHRHGWAPALAWDDIDDPAATPDTGRGDKRAGVQVEDVEWLVRHERHTWDTLAARFGIQVGGLKQALHRAGRHDLMRRITDTSQEAAA